MPIIIQQFPGQSNLASMLARRRGVVGGVGLKFSVARPFRAGSTTVVPTYPNQINVPLGLSDSRAAHGRDRGDCIGCRSVLPPD
jgi:hypothetical protein